MITEITKEASIIDGKKIADELCKEITTSVELLKNTHNITPGLAVILVGDDAASAIYVNNKKKRTVAVGMNSYEYILPANISEAELLTKIHELNQDDKVNGILVQLPLPSHICESVVINNIDPSKDVDGFHAVNTGLLSTNQKHAIVPCTPLGCLILLKKTLGENLAGLKAVILGKSNIVGKPMAMLLLNHDCTVSILNSKSKNTLEEVRSADIVISATGKSGLVKKEWIKKGAVVIDVGINRITLEDGTSKIVGDVDFPNVKQVASAITPVPKGVGPMTIACLLKNTLDATIRQNNIELNIGNDNIVNTPNRSSAIA